MKKITFIFCLFVSLNLLAEEGRILRFPNSSESQITFTHAGDIFVVPISGGLARRVTSSDGVELHPRFSPDGKTIAFTGEYDGNRELYTMPSEGGTPKRLTYSMDVGSLPERMGPDKIIMQWVNNGNDILYRPRHENWQAWTGKLFTISKNGGMPKQVAVPNSGHGTLNTDGTKLAYNRIFRDFRTWKRYRGGQADDIWIYDLKTKQLENITNNPAQDIIPMWVGNKIYFISDRDKVMNLFVYNITTKETKKLTDFKEYDVKYPSLGKNHIAFENGGYVYLLDFSTEETKKINIEINEDFPQARTKITNVKDKIGSYEISPDGKRALFSARGDIFTVPAEKGYTRNLTKSSNAHDRNPQWSPDGKWIAYVSDKNGNDEIYLTTPDGSEEVQLTKDSKSYRFELKWSPDSKKILASDKTMRLYYIDIDSKTTNEITKSKMWEIRDYNWSPDSKWIAYGDNLHSGLTAIYLYSLDSKKITQATSEFYDCGNPIFTPGGNYLLFVSNRNYNANISSVEWNYSYNDMSRIYALALNKEAPHLFAFQDEESEKPIAKKGPDDDKKDDKDQVKVKIDIDGLMDRIIDFPIEAGNYWNLYPTKDHKLYYTRSQQGKPVKTYIYDIKNKKESEVGDFNSFTVSEDGKKVIVSKDNSYFITKLSDKLDFKDGKLNLDDMKMNLDKTEEWKQIYYEAWRQMRDFFYDPNMHGVDWNMIRKRYEVFIPHIKHRNDLTYILGEMIAELNVGHAYAGGGDAPKINQVGVGLLGCEFELEKGKYKIKKIFKGKNWEEKTRSPLNEVGINVNEGDFLISIDGEKPSENVTPFELMVDKVGKYVSIVVVSNAKGDNPRTFNVKTIASESGLRYLDWVEGNLEYVTKKTDGKIGYIHIPDMGVGNGLNEFVKYFYPQIRKEALIIDDRYNGGGNVSSMIIERLKREIGIAKNIRNQELVTSTPDAVMTGPMVCMINELSASDGDLFPFQFKINKLGKLIGRRSWGGVIGIRGSLPFLDGGYLMKPEFANFSPEGKWALEGEGMTPDIDVDNNPAKVMDGIDEQLDKAIEVLLEDIKTNPKRQIPKVPAYPDKK